MKTYQILEMFPDFVLLTKQTDLEKEVSSVSVMDAPDIDLWMKGGEFLISSGYALSLNPNHFYDLIDRVKAKNIAALGIKVHRYMKFIPPEVIQHANANDVTIIEIPLKYAFTEIIHPILSVIINLKYKELTISEEISNDFLSIGIDEVSYEKIIGLLAHYIEGDALYYNYYNQKYYRQNAVSHAIDIPLSSYFKSVIREGTKTHGVLYTKPTCDPFIHQLALRHAITMLRLCTQSMITMRRMEEQRRNDFLTDLILNQIHNEDELNYRSREYGWKLHEGIFCARIQIEQQTSIYEAVEEDREVLLLFKDQMRETGKNFYYVVFTNYIVLLFAGEETIKNRAMICSKLKEIMHKIAPKRSLTIGIGRTYQNIFDTWRSFHEASRAAEIGAALFGDTRIYEYEQIALYDVLFGSDVEKIMDNVYVQMMEALGNEDRDCHSVFISTVRALIQADWKVKAASTLEHVHYNTMKYRVAKLKERTGWDLDKKEEKFLIEAAFKIFLAFRETKSTKEPASLRLSDT